MRLQRHYLSKPVIIKDTGAIAGSYDAVKALSIKPVIIKDAGAIAGNYDADKGLSIKTIYN